VVGHSNGGYSAGLRWMCALAFVFGAYVGWSPTIGRAQGVRGPGAPLFAWQTAPGAQDSGASPASTDASKTAAPKIDLPEGDGKPIATEFCQDCHMLKNLLGARKSQDEWKDTVQTMIDRGSRLPPDKVNSLVQYLAKNFGPGQAAPASAGAAAPATAPSGAASQPNKASDLPDGDGKTIATEYCQDCHKLTNLTSAHKSLDDWKDTLQMMVDRGSRLPPDKVSALLQYLAKNFPATN
jgi:cytochrome c5